jgi:hypothetical protein
MKQWSAVLPAGALALVLLAGASPASCGGSSTSGGTALKDGAPTSSTSSGERGKEFRAKLTGFQETPAISTPGHGTFRASLSEDGTTVSFELTYADLKGVGEGGAPAIAHIHFGQRNVAGGVAVFLCGGGGRDACPAQPGTVTGTFTAADVVGPTVQGLEAGDLAALLQAARAGFTYANVHTARFATGEIRGQLKADDDDGHEGDGGQEGDDD